MGELNGSSKKRVFLTGGSGFIASHVLDALLDAGFHVVTTARSDEKGQRIAESVKPNEVSYVVVEDVAADGAFDAALRTEGPFDYVVHTASPYYLNAKEAREFLEPAIRGTAGLLRSVQAHAPTVRRVVITSSSAAILNPPNHARVYDETCWRQTTWEEAQDPKVAYAASKLFAEKAAWAFIEDEKPPFDLATINCTYVFGPVQRGLPGLDAMNASNHRIRDMVLGRMRDGLAPTAPVFTWVDVRDVAAAHLAAMTVPRAGGQRFYVVGGHFSNKRIADAIRAKFPRLAAERLPPDTADTAGDDLPPDVYGFDNRRSREVLGLRYTGLEQSVVDTVQSILDMAPQQAV
ncbi:ketoreductase [Xylariaceae sp. FL0804]|nr:ketoreductase [Xylariaceae sp. FL0804]